MAIIKINSLVGTIHGSIGNLVVRQYQGKTVLSSKSIPQKKQSELQRKNRIKFRHASAWAKAVLLNPDKKTYYNNKAIKLNLPNAYTAAIRDFLRKGNIHKMNHDIKTTHDTALTRIGTNNNDPEIIQNNDATNTPQLPTSPAVRQPVKKKRQREHFCSVHYIQNILNTSSPSDGLPKTYSDQ